MKTKVAVIYGGVSGEHEISLRSGYAIINNLNSELFDVIPIAIDKEGKWWINDFSEVVTHSNDTCLVTSSKSRQFEPNLSQGLADVADVVFPIMHGPLYEDGVLQGFLDLCRVPYVGCNVVSSAIAMDKKIMKDLVAYQGICVVPSQLILKSAWQKSPDRVLQQLQSAFELPIFVKPNNLGSSVGNHLVKTSEQLAVALDDAFQYENAVLVEKFINAREIELAVLENIDDPLDPLVSVPGEIKVCDSRYDYYSYEAKYDDKSDIQLDFPAKLTDQQIQQAQEIAKQVFLAIRAESMGRIDLFLNQADQKFYFNEMNSLPGFTSISMYPKLWQVSGLPFTELLTKLVQLAMQRHECQAQIKRVI